MPKHRKRRRRSVHTARRRRSYRRRSNPFSLFAAPRRRRRSHRRRANPHRRHRRRNPGAYSAVKQFASGSMLSMIGGGAAGFFGARFIPQNVPFLAQYNTGLTGYALNIASGLGVSWAVSKFWNRQAGVGAMVGTGLAVLSRILVEQGNIASGGGVSGDLDFDLGYYIDDAYPFAQGAAAGPYATFPGTPRSGYAALPTSASAVRAGHAAAAAVAALPAGSSGNAGGWKGAGRWPSR